MGKRWWRKCFSTEALRYLFFGGLTTLFNLAVFLCLRYGMKANVNQANFWSIAASVLFAYVGNRWFVFQKNRENRKGIAAEFFQFAGMRLGTMAVEYFGVAFLNESIGVESFLSKLIMQVIVIFLNYVISKCFVFCSPLARDDCAKRNLFTDRR